MFICQCPGNKVPRFTEHRTFNRLLKTLRLIYAAAGLAKIIPANFSGIIQCEGYSVYPAFAERHGQPITLAVCWAHVRREAWRTFYVIEARIRDNRGSAKLRAVTLTAESRLIIERIRTILRDMKKQRRHFPASQLENAIRPTTVDKKNWLFIGDADAGQRSAIVLTVIEDCRRRGIDPFEYLREVFARMPTMAAKDYPGPPLEAWAKERTPTKPASKASPTKLASSRQRHCA